MFYDNFSSDYDRFVSWPGRLALEMPFLTSRLREIGANSVLDAACGTGMHTLALAQAGFEAALKLPDLGNWPPLSARPPATRCSAWEIPCRTCSPRSFYLLPWPISP